MMDMWADRVLAAMAGTTTGDSDGHTWEDWHKALGHVAPQTLKQMWDSGLVEGMKVIESLFDFDCIACIQGKQAIQPFPKELTTKYLEIGELIVTDLWGLAQVTGQGGYCYFISFTDSTTSLPS